LALVFDVHSPFLVVLGRTLNLLGEQCQVGCLDFSSNVAFVGGTPLVYHEFSLHPANHVHVKPTLCNDEAWDSLATDYI
jgi:hypothetical protein